MTLSVDFEAIKIAYSRIRASIRKTPIDYSWWYSQQSQANVYFKWESLQITGSFKLRGALNKMLQLRDEAKKTGIIAASAGNHAQGIGYSAQKANISVTMVVPGNTPQTKLQAIRQYGVDLQIHGKIYDEAEAYAIQLSQQTGKPFVSPYNDPDIIAGQGTVALEILEDHPDTDVIIVPVSGGGLLSGIALAAKTINPNIQVFGVQSEACPVMVESLRHGMIVDVPMEHSIAEGLHGGVEKGAITFPIIQQYVDDVILVSEEEIKKAILDLIKYHHQIAEGSGAVVAAAILKFTEKWRSKKVVGVISGGNLDIEVLKSLF
jgi:threonine dehydratase